MIMFKKLIYVIVAAVCITAFGACGQNEQPQITTVEFEPDPGPDATAQGNTGEVKALPATPQEAFPVNDENEIDISGVWDGYTELDFKSFFTKGITNMYALIEGVSLEKCEIFATNGWDCEGLLDENTVAQGNRAVTYVVYLTQKHENGISDRGYKFYMELSPDGVLAVKGAESFEGGAEYGEVYDEDEAKSLLAELKEAI